MGILEKVGNAIRDAVDDYPIFMTFAVFASGVLFGVFW